MISEDDVRRGQKNRRATETAIVPYVRIPFEPDAVVGVRVGPGRHVDLRERGVAGLLQHHGYDALVRSSEIPLRT